MSDIEAPWILSELDQAAKDWENQPEWMKPLTDAPYFASRRVATEDLGTDPHHG